MGSREEFDLTEKLIKEGMTDEESAAYWQAKNAKIVVIKHGMKVPQPTQLTDRSSASSHFRLRQEKASAAATDTAPDSCMDCIRAGRSSIVWSSVLQRHP